MVAAPLLSVLLPWEEEEEAPMAARTGVLVEAEVEEATVPQSAAAQLNLQSREAFEASAIPVATVLMEGTKAPEEEAQADLAKTVLQIPMEAKEATVFCAISTVSTTEAVNKYVVSGSCMYHSDTYWLFFCMLFVVCVFPGGGGSAWQQNAGVGGKGGGGGGNQADAGGSAGAGGGSARNNGQAGTKALPMYGMHRVNGGAGGLNTGGGGGGSGQADCCTSGRFYKGWSGRGGSGVVVLKIEV